MPRQLYCEYSMIHWHCQMYRDCAGVTCQCHTKRLGSGTGQTTAFVNQTRCAMGRNVKTPLSQHTAVPAISGYMYQLQLACLRLFDVGEGEQLGIEVLDDIHVERDGTPLELSQAKYHRQRSNLTSRSEEFWKTLGIWARAIGEGSLDLATTRCLVLMTRAGVTRGSIPGMIALGASSPVVIDAFKAGGKFKSKKTTGRL